MDYRVFTLLYLVILNIPHLRVRFQPYVITLHLGGAQHLGIDAYCNSYSSNITDVCSYVATPYLRVCS